MLLNIQDANNISTHSLNTGGYNGNVLKVTLLEIPTSQQHECITEEYSEERRELVSKATTCGKLFSTIGGGHITSDDIFVGVEL